jgi:hypothetical protein
MNNYAPPKNKILFLLLKELLPHRAIFPHSHFPFDFFPIIIKKKNIYSAARAKSPFLSSIRSFLNLQSLGSAYLTGYTSSGVNFS